MAGTTGEAAVFPLPRSEGGKEALRVMIELRESGRCSQGGAPLDTFDFDQIAATFSKAFPGEE